ncbi:MAG: DUF998 domain-containing protein [Euryarchaeota archaeon]|jgi:hypothetical membrane protein|nr:DUF998 domain-containing protein [Euryarchaeota archaeon]
MWQAIDRERSGITRVAGICGVFIPVVIFTSLGVSIASSPWFTWTQHAFSDLGIQENTAALFNYGMIFGGILVLVFSFGLMKILSKKLGAYVLALSSLALIGIGVFPETIFTLHFLTSASFFVLLVIALLTIGLTSRFSSFERNIGLLAIVLVIIAIGSTVFLFHFDGIAITEALSCFPAFIWCSIVGIKMTRASG